MYHESNCRISPQTFLSFHVSCCVPGHVLRTHGSRPSTHHPLHSGISWPKKRVAIWKGQLLDLKAHGCTQLRVGYLEPTRWPWPYQGFVLQADLDCSIIFFLRPRNGLKAVVICDWLTWVLRKIQCTLFYLRVIPTVIHQNL